MEGLILYFGKVIICSGVMFLYYQLSLKDRTFHHYNRFYLLMAMIISILLPLLKIEDFTIEVSNNVYVLLNKLQNLNSDKTAEYDYFYFRIVFSALGLVSFYFLGKLIYGIFKIVQFKNQFQKETYEDVNFYQTDLSEAPFSYFKNLFWKNTIIINSDIGKQILKHEMVHIEQKHSYDKIFIEIITAVFWFNPFFHIIKKEISLIHEYLADKKAIKQSDTKAFAQMLLASHFSVNELPATSPFLSSNLKKRLKMLQKPQTKFGYVRRIFALPVLFTVAFAYMVNAKNREIITTNIEIEKAVSEIKRDTITPQNKIDKIVERQQAKISKANEELKIQSEKLKTLSEKSKEKSEELKKIAREQGDKSYEFELKAKELKQLSGEMDKMINKDFSYTTDFEFSDKMKNRILSQNSKSELENLQLNSVGGDRFKIKMNGKELNINEIFDTKEFKENSGMTDVKIKALKNKLKTGEGTVSTFYFDGKDVPVNSDFPKLKLNSYLNDTSKLSKKEIRRLEKLSREKAELTKKQAEISIKKAEITKEQIKMQGNPWIISVNAHAKPGTTYTGVSTYIDSDKLDDKAVIIARSGQADRFKNLEKYKSDADIRIFINGKSTTKSEMDHLKSNDISSINVYKSTTDGKGSGEIHIKTKE